MREDYQNVRAHYEQLGYKLVSQETLPATFADHDLNVIIHLTHGTEKVTEQRIINEDIRYEFVEGGIAAPSYQAAPKLEFPTQELLLFCLTGSHLY